MTLFICRRCATVYGRKIASCHAWVGMDQPCGGDVDPWDAMAGDESLYPVPVDGNGIATLGALSGREAVYGFADWLSTRRIPTIFGASYSQASVQALVEAFCDANRLPAMRSGSVWFGSLKRPSSV